MAYPVLERAWCYSSVRWLWQSCQLHVLSFLSLSHSFNPGQRGREAKISLPYTEQKSPYQGSVWRTKGTTSPGPNLSHCPPLWLQVECSGNCPFTLYERQFPHPKRSLCLSPPLPPSLPPSTTSFSLTTPTPSSGISGTISQVFSWTQEFKHEEPYSQLRCVQSRGCSCNVRKESGVFLWN